MSQPVTSLTVSSTNAAAARTDALVIGVHKGPKGLVLAAGSADVAKAFGKSLLPALVGLGATGKAEEVTTLASLGATKAAVVFAVGLGDQPEVLDPEGLRRAAGAAVRALAGAARSAAIALPAEDAVSLRAVAEGALLGAYSFTAYRQTSLAEQKAPVAALTVLSGLKGARAVAHRPPTCTRSSSRQRRSSRPSAWA
jgi:leucyl aminopeptidase